MADKKSFRPKANTGQGLVITFPNSGRDEASSGTYKTIKTWPYETADPYEIEQLTKNPLVTDQPEPSASGAKKGGDK